MICPAPFRAASAQKPYRPGLLRRSLAYIANGDLPPMFTFGGVPFLTVLERSEHVAEWIKLTEEKVKLAQLAPVSE